MDAEIVGRDDELALVSAFLERAGEGVTALELEGAAGIGKSTLWLAGVAEARTQGLRVLVSRPAEAERSLAFARARRPLRRSARRGAPVGDAAATAGARSGAARYATQRARQWILARSDSPCGARWMLAVDAPLVVAVDDVQWLDASSAASLAFALRRLPDANILLLLARRRSSVGGGRFVERDRAGSRSSGCSVGL